MRRESAADATYRHGEWGPAYLIQGSSSDLGVVLLRPGDHGDTHYHAQCDETFFVLEGECVLWTDARHRTVLAAGDAVRCEPGELHYLVNESDAPFRCVFIKSPGVPGDTHLVAWKPGDAPPTMTATERPTPRTKEK